MKTIKSKWMSAFAFVCVTIWAGELPSAASQTVQTNLAVRYDAANNLLFVACNNKLLIAMDATSGKIITSLPIGDAAGNVAYDAFTRNIFVSARDGTVTVAHEDSSDKISPVQTFNTTKGASVLEIDVKTHKIYVGTANYVTANGDLPQNAVPIPGSLKISIYGQ